jgi:flagellar biosynthesis GTPase FlhF
MSAIKPLHIIKPRAHPIATFMTEEFIKGAVIEKKYQSTCPLVYSRNGVNIPMAIKMPPSNLLVHTKTIHLALWWSSYIDGGIRG